MSPPQHHWRTVPFGGWAVYDFNVLEQCNYRRTANVGLLVLRYGYMVVSLNKGSLI